MMKRIFLLILCSLIFSGITWAAPSVEMKTNLGTIVIELDAEKAPLSVENFLGYVDSKYYDGTIFHRVIDGFMIQGGGFTETDSRKQTQAPIKNEAANGLKNNKGTIAMARTGVVDSATSQFFINLVDNDFLNYRGPAPQTYGYAVFGKVTSGMDVVEKIGKVSTVTKGRQFQNYPMPQVVIESVRRLE
ncbi:MAG: peptidylprolyl isomerase A [Desulfuromonas sp.]|nr:MAG: peptidylprolyl isomerase A [Desulfuromonas sp.]